MQEIVNLSINAMNEAEANAIAESVIAYCNSSYEENFRIWGSDIYISENTVKNDSESKMYYFDYESLKKTFLKKSHKTFLITISMGLVCIVMMTEILL